MCHLLRKIKFIYGITNVLIYTEIEELALGQQACHLFEMMSLVWE